MKKLYIYQLYTIPDIARIFNCTVQYIYKIFNIKSTLNENNINNSSNNQIVTNKNNINDLFNNQIDVNKNNTDNLSNNNSNINLNNLLTGDK